MRSTALCLAIWWAAGPFAHAAGPLTRISQIKDLRHEQAVTHQPVLLRAVVTQVIPEWSGFSVEDSTDAIYIKGVYPLPPSLQAGREVEIAGNTEGGNFAPTVVASAVKILGPAPLPKPQAATWQELATGGCDNRYVEVQGVVRSAGMVGPPTWDWRAAAMRIDVGGNFLWAYVRSSAPLANQRLVDGTVRVRGICIVYSNSQRQFQGTALSVSQASDVEVLRPGPADPFDAPEEPLSRLFVFHSGAAAFHRVKIAGTATLQIPGGVYVQDGNEGVLVRTRGAPPVHPGDRVEAVGFPEPVGFTTVLDDGMVRVTGPGSQPAPHHLAAKAVLARVANAPTAPAGVLLSVAGRILDRGKSAQDETLTLAAGLVTFRARLRARAGELSAFQPGSTVEITGVSELQVDERGQPESFELLMRSPADARILKSAPWLSRRVALEAATALLAFLAVAGVWLALLRRRVEQQTAIIREQFARVATLRERYTQLVENATDLVYVRDLQGRLLDVNRGLEQMTGYTREELLGMNVVDLLAPEERERVRGELALIPSEGAPPAAEWRFRAKDGSELVIETKNRFLVEDGQPALVEAIGRDITDRQRAQIEAVNQRDRLQEQLHHSQKMESVGLLAGGIAHDFNNLLTIIGGYAQMIRDSDPEDRGVRDSVAEIAHAAERAAGLTRQLLVFSRRQAVDPKGMSLNEAATHVGKMLRRLIGEDIRLVLRLEARTAIVVADTGQIEQAILNLSINGRDAMPDGGTLEIRTRDLRVDGKCTGSYPGVAEGEYVMLSVIDSGLGMTQEVRTRIFEPFFTTKETGKGTGLGLSMVYGIVHQSGGAIFVDSAPGRGSTFDILLPAAEAAAGNDEEAEATAPRSRGETILLVEDEGDVRRYIRKVLAANGYQVLEAAHGKEALEIAERHSGPIHLLLSDVVMPELGGAELAERFLVAYPGTPVLHISGYSDRSLGLNPEFLLEKPFAAPVLLARVREVLRNANGAKGRHT